MSDARLSAVVVEKEPVFTLLMMTLFRSSRLHLQGQWMSHWYGKTCCGENLVIDQQSSQWNQRQKQLPVTSQVFSGFLGTSAASGPLARKRTSPWRFQAQTGLHMWNPGWGGGTEKEKAIIWLHLFKDPSFQKQAAADDEQWNAE